MLIQTQVGPIATTSSMASGSQSPARAGQLGDLITSELHGRYYEQCYRRNIFSAANQAVAAATTAAFATTYVGLYVANPVGSTVNAVILKVGYGFIVAQPTGGNIIGLMAGYHASTNVTAGGAITPRSNYIGVGAAPVCTAGAGSATLPIAPTLVQVFGSVLTGAITVSNTNPLTVMDMEGSLILPPGGFACIYTFIASAASSLVASFTWEEVPV